MNTLIKTLTLLEVDQVSGGHDDVLGQRGECNHHYFEDRDAFNEYARTHPMLTPQYLTTFPLPPC